MLRMMRSAASGGGEKYWEFAYDLGGGWQIMKLRLPGMERESKIFVNVMRVYVPTGPQNLARASLNMMGFSLNLP